MSGRRVLIMVCPGWEHLSHILRNPGHYESGYLQCGNGGSLSISAPSMALDGLFLGTTVVGPRQRTVSPTLSTLSLAFESRLPTAPYPLIAPKPPAISFQNG